MPVYKWEGRTRQGSIKKGVLEAANEAAVMTQLRAQSIVPIAVKQKAKDIEITLFERVTTKELVVFTRQFATMIDAGLPLVQCLEIQSEQQPNKAFKKILKEVKNDVEQGSTFADSLRKHPKAFDDLYVNLVTAGEVGGILDTILNRLATYLEKADALARQVKGAMVYPVTILVVAIGVIILLLVKVIPVFEKMFSDFGGILPAPTQIVVNMSHWLQANVLYLLAGVALVIVAWVQARKRSKAFRYHTDRIFLMLPIFGAKLVLVGISLGYLALIPVLVRGAVPIAVGSALAAQMTGVDRVSVVFFGDD